MKLYMKQRRQNIHNLLNLELDDKLYARHELCGRFSHCSEFSDEEYSKLDKNRTNLI